MNVLAAQKCMIGKLCFVHTADRYRDGYTVSADFPMCLSALSFDFPLPFYRALAIPTSSLQPVPMGSWYFYPLATENPK